MGLGGAKKLKNIGISNKESRKVTITFIDATMTNSTSNVEPVNAKTPNPIDVVRFARNNVRPIVEALVISDASLSFVMA